MCSLTLYLHLYFVKGSSEGTDESAQIQIIDCITRQCDQSQHLVYWSVQHSRIIQ